MTDWSIVWLIAWSIAGSIDWLIDWLIVFFFVVGVAQGGGAGAVKFAGFLRKKNWAWSPVIRFRNFPSTVRRRCAWTNGLALFVRGAPRRWKIKSFPRLISRATQPNHDDDTMIMFLKDRSPLWVLWFFVSSGRLSPLFTVSVSFFLKKPVYLRPNDEHVCVERRLEDIFIRGPCLHHQRGMGCWLAGDLKTYRKTSLEKEMCWPVRVRWDAFFEEKKSVCELFMDLWEPTWCWCCVSCTANWMECISLKKQRDTGLPGQNSQENLIDKKRWTRLEVKKREHFSQVRNIFDFHLQWNVSVDCLINQIKKREDFSQVRNIFDFHLQWNVSVDCLINQIKKRKDFTQVRNIFDFHLQRNVSVDCLINQIKKRKDFTQVRNIFDFHLQWNVSVDCLIDQNERDSTAASWSRTVCCLNYSKSCRFYSKDLEKKFDF